MHPMSKTTAKEPMPTCACKNCLCRRGPGCRCDTYRALLALALWDYGRSLGRRKITN